MSELSENNKPTMDNLPTTSSSQGSRDDIFKTYVQQSKRLTLLGAVGILLGVLILISVHETIPQILACLVALFGAVMFSSAYSARKPDTMLKTFSQTLMQMPTSAHCEDLIAALEASRRGSIYKNTKMIVERAIEKYKSTPDANPELLKKSQNLLNSIRIKRIV